jgi:hypothetical protein
MRAIDISAQLIFRFVHSVVRFSPAISITVFRV